MSTVAEAEGLVDEIIARFGSGNTADDLRDQLVARVAEIGRHMAGAGKTLPETARTAIARLLVRIQTATSSGEAWLEQAGSELAPRATRARVLRAYGLRPRDT